MTDFSTAFRWATEHEGWVDADAAEDNDKALEQWLGALPQFYTPTLALSDGSVPGYFVSGTGRWERQRGQFVVATYVVSIVGPPGATARRVGVSLPTAPATVTLPVGGVWWFPTGGQKLLIRAVGAFPSVAVAQFPIAVGATYYADIGAESGFAGAGDVVAGLIVYRERV